MTFKIAGHRVIVKRQQIVCHCSRHRDEAARAIVAHQHDKTDDCEGNWGGFGVGPFIVAVQV